MKRLTQYSVTEQCTHHQNIDSEETFIQDSLEIQRF